MVPLEDEIDPFDFESEECDQVKDLLKDPLQCLVFEFCGFCDWVSSNAENGYSMSCQKDMMKAYQEN